MYLVHVTLLPPMQDGGFVYFLLQNAMNIKHAEVAAAPQAAATTTHPPGRPLGHDGAFKIFNNRANQIFLKWWNLAGKHTSQITCFAEQLK